MAVYCLVKKQLHLEYIHKRQNMFLERNAIKLKPNSETVWNSCGYSKAKETRIAMNCNCTSILAGNTKSEPSKIIVEL